MITGGEETKVYELMSKLSEFQAGAEVRIRLLKDSDEMVIFDTENDTREIDCAVNTVDSYNNNTVLLSD